MAIGEAMYATISAFLRERPRQPLVLALGEPFHGEETFPLLRNDLLRGLVEHERCRCVTLESDCLAGRSVDDYVRGGDGRLGQVTADGISHGFGASPANHALVEWLRGHNRVRPPEDQVRFAGFDGPLENNAESGAHSPRLALRMLHGLLDGAPTAEGSSLPHSWDRIEELLGDDARWSDPAATMDPSRSVGDTSEARELRLIGDDLSWLLASRNLTGEARYDADLAARTAAGLLAYHAALARTEPRERLERCMGIRDAMMAANLRALTTRERALAHGPSLVFAHNEHLRRDTVRMRYGPMDVTWTPAGAHLARAYGASYAVIATAIGTAPHHGIGAPPPDTLEGLLSATTSTPRLFPAAELTALLATSPPLSPRPQETRAYLPLPPTTPTDFDAVLFLPHVEGAGVGG
ncbi:erythromycin esterase family protein [Streptomyces sp. NBC_01498]|uniref:erythromycin esterase family protein n=1 Tax=Streptomyces sp. NBC_01498 TaxID=2975870 RepID=UPI002E7C4D06|nr:erythromycin esterase family protein [Streptomyces sp. NBC_01498]WTL23627.1 erythromycin esterase family protein [Streptomyces sp. NBC_01498]